ncbi:MAG: metallopeptidase TldD-related protein [Acidobacteriota bacterium]
MTRPEEGLAAIQKAGFSEAEVYAKRGRSRRLEIGPGGAAPGSSQSTFCIAVEEGWAARAGGSQGTLFLAGTGTPRPAGAAWPSPSTATGAALRLPEPPSAAALADWRPPVDLESPLLGESEARAVLDGIARELARELPGARLSSASLEEGSSESELVSTRGMNVRWRSRAALLRVEAVLPGARGNVSHRATLDAGERLAQSFAPAAIARRLADRLHVLQEGSAPERDRGEFLLAPPIGARLLLGLLPMLLGRSSSPATQSPSRSDTERILTLQRGSRIASSCLTIVDDGRLAGGVLAAPVDGEGSATRELVLIADGEARQPLLPWWAARPPETRASGCVRRAGFRDQPGVGPSHLYVRPRAETSVASLLGGVARGYYLLDATGSGRWNFEADRFALPVCGFAVQSGRSMAPVAGAWLCGGISALLRGVQAVARDLAFFPLDGMLGAPTLLVTGLELRRAAPPV